MSRGGKRERSGRPPGALNKRTQAIIQAAMDAGELPVCYMLRIMRDEKVAPTRRDEMAKAAANFVHSRVWAVGAADEAELEETQPASALAAE